MSDTTFTGIIMGAQTIELDGIEYTARIEPDDLSLLDEQGEGMWCGRIEWTRGDDYGSRKPADFVNGRTVKLVTDDGSTLWWEVPADVPMGERRELERAIRDILDYGYVGVVVESNDGQGEALWGIAPSDYNYQTTVANELLDQLMAAREQDLAMVDANINAWVTVGMVTS